MKKAVGLSLLIVIALVAPGCTATDPGFTTIVGDSKVKIVDDDLNIITIDETSRAIATLTFEHKKLHEGDSYSFCDVTDVANGANVTVLLITPNTSKRVHLFWGIEHELESNTKLYEDTTYSDNGTEATPNNRNRESLNTAEMKVYKTPVVTAYGTLICEAQEGSGKKSGGVNRQGNERILKPNTAYTLVIVNATANNNTTSTEINWYEHTPLD